MNTDSVVHEATTYLDRYTGSYGWRCTCGDGSRPIMPGDVAGLCAKSHAAPPLPMSELDELRIQHDALRALVGPLRAIRDAAHYIAGPSGCIDPELRDCEEYGDDETGEDPPEVEWCSHVEHRYANYADVYIRERLEWLVNEVHGLVATSTDGIGAEVREAVHGAISSMASDNESPVNVDCTREPYKTIVEAA